MAARLASIAREPLLHVLLLGAALFVVLPRSGGEAPSPRPRIVVTPSDVDRALTSWTGAGAPTKEELAGLVDGIVAEEVLLREAPSLARGDDVVRDRLRRKVDAMAEEAAAGDPSDEDLQAFYESRQGGMRTIGREAVEREWRAARRREARERVLGSLRAHYDVVIEWPAWAPGGDPAAGMR